LEIVTVSERQAQAQELKDLAAYGELAIYYTVTRQEGEISPRQRSGILRALRDLLEDFPPSPAADHAIGKAFEAARLRAAGVGEDVSSWPEQCPWGLGGLIDAASAMIAELEMQAPLPIRVRKEKRADARETRGKPGPKEPGRRKRVGASQG
jgi:hypothetical protein